MDPAYRLQRLARRPGLILSMGMILLSGIFIPRVTAAPSAQVTYPSPTPIAQPTPTLVPLVRLAKPAFLANITDQANRGAEKYWGVCMACHGDRNQGLTDEWRSAYGLDNNCWARGCHGPDHPPEGFEIPRELTIPALAGAGHLGRFANAQELYDYILANMPWWKPGSLSSEDAWALTAHLLRINGTWPPNLVLSARNASAVSVHYLAAQPTNDRLAAGILAGILGLAAFGLILQTALERKSTTVQSTNHSRPSFFHHLHPPTIPALQARFRYTLGAGGAAVFLSLILLVTGALEMFYYSPTPEKAAISIETITYLIPFGGLIRGLHFWSAQALVVVMTIHLLRVVLTGAYIGRRRLNFLIGLGTLLVILLLDFTGYILRWDEGIRWALVVGTNLLKSIPWIGDGVYQFVVGGPEPGPASLVRFYSWHIFALTLGFIILVFWHIFRIRRDGGIAVPPPGEREQERRISRFDLVKREVVAMVITGILLLAIVALFPAPIAEPMSSSATESVGKAPWFFLWVQQLLKLGDPFIWGVITPSLVLLVFALIPFILPVPGESDLGKWFPHRGRLAQALVILIIIAIVILTILAILPSDFVP